MKFRERKLTEDAESEALPLFIHPTVPNKSLIAWAISHRSEFPGIEKKGSSSLKVRRRPSD
jgi:hypothetical protein